ncbi:MAG: hypothetical protein B7Y80_17775 [Hyphomicrobium sp. 32-62-53]|nr:MAG: hypothetical protein B7Z29_17030 [Hyphomicrobium sp. 12-62-95]OYX97998.1 MAG: hypothetical protein B7Y80_17775 [Hyphomicrobium sp. 32-62-53]
MGAVELVYSETMMKKLGVGLVAIIVTTGCLAGSQFQFAGEAEARSYKRHYGGYHHRSYKRWRARRIARGVAVGVGAAIALESARRYRYSCSNLAYRCRHGAYWACERFDDRC